MSSTIYDNNESKFFLSLPRGSVRAILAIQIVGMFWLLLLMPHRADGTPVPIPLHLYLLLGLVLVFFISHGRTIASASEPEPSPLGLPGGTIRVLLVGGTVAILSYLHFSQGVNLAERLTPEPEQVRDNWIYFFSAMIGGFTLGYVIKALPLQRNNFFRALQAWLSVIAMLLLVADIILELTILPTIKRPIDTSTWETFLTAVTACYFGIRS